MTKEEMNQQYEENQALVTFTIRKFFPDHIKDEDIFQIGCIGLWIAVQNHNPEKGKFSGYAVTCIRHEIGRHFQTLNTMKRKAVTSSLDEVIAENAAKGHDAFLYDIVAGQPDVGFFDADGILKKLDEKNRFVLARLAKGYSQGEISRDLGCRKQTVSLRVKKIREIVKEHV